MGASGSERRRAALLDASERGAAVGIGSILKVCTECHKTNSVAQVER
jgi:hypothetical protein